MLGNILGIRIKDKIKKRRNSTKICYIIKKLKIKYAGHSARENKDKWNLASTFRIPKDRKRKKSRPVTRRIDELKEICPGWAGTAQNRKNWSQVAEIYARKWADWRRYVVDPGLFYLFTYLFITETAILPNNVGEFSQKFKNIEEILNPEYQILIMFPLLNAVSQKSASVLSTRSKGGKADHSEAKKFSAHALTNNWNSWTKLCHKVLINKIRFYRISRSICRSSRVTHRCRRYRAHCRAQSKLCLEFQNKLVTFTNGDDAKLLERARDGRWKDETIRFRKNPKRAIS